MTDYSVSYEQEGLVQFVIDSVYALSHAIHHLLQDTCTGSFKSCLSRGQLTGEEVLKYIRNVSFTGISGDLVRFNEKGDGLGRYDIFQFQRITDSKFDYVKVGEWTDKLFINSSKIRWKDQSLVHPRSVCSESCKFGYAKNNTEETATCCWICIKCGDSQYLFNEFTCKECPEGHKPNANVTGCVPLPVVHLDWDSLWVLLPTSFSTAGIMSTCFVLYVFIRHNTTPIIMASGRELCYVLLTGIILAYTTSFVLLARPSVTICTVKRFILGISLCLIYAAMLTKTNRIYRIFNTGIKVMVKRPGYTSPKSQIFICFSLVSVQIIGGITWLCFEKPETMYEQQNKDFLVLKCRASQIAILLSLMYNMFLIVLCTVFGFKTRKIPQNFNEAKYIAFTMYSTCIVWLAFIPIYFGANHDFKIETTSLCMCVSISASVALVCLFGPKVYIVIFQPHKNIRQAATPSLQTASRSFPRPYVPAQFSITNCDSDRNGIATSMNNSNAKVDNITNMFSDSMEEGEEGEDEFGNNDEGNENRPMEDKATSTDDINTL
ncbi:hypothetical protein CHS0354_031751 [Potamilus streckersoni]|uniref:G-protein coupled receptors family 3 profile domain-containing protein n=1 Tax=Potamilus streckersoni TaxID=2493646 RepID=A0AAE0T651_9BIVA|nr:hypothetical protein CHS0354_031751 [Potamilus streckersoni]